MKQRSIRSKLDKNSRGVTFEVFGRNKNDRFTDEELAGVAAHPEIDHVCLRGQPITKLPPFVAPKVLQLRKLPALESLAGIEKMVSLRSVDLHEELTVAADSYKRLAELPELVELGLDPPANGALPSTIAKLPSVITIELVCKPGFDLDGALALLAKLKTLRALKIERLEGPLPDTLGKLTSLERLEVTGKVTALPRSIGKLRVLKHLDVRFNKIKLIPDELWELTALEHLDLCYNPIKILSPKVAQLKKLVTLDLALTYIHAVPKELGQLASLRELRTAQKMKEMPPEVYALRLDRYTGPHDKFTLRDVETPEDSEVRLVDPDRIPDSFGQPTKLEINWRAKTPPLAQLARCSTLRELRASVRDLATVVPYIPAHIVVLDLFGETALAKLPALPHLERLTLYAPKAGDLSVGFPALTELFFNAPGVPMDLARTQLARLRLANCKAPKLAELRGLPLTEIALRGVKHLDLDELCAVLASKSLAHLDLSYTRLGKLPAAIGTLWVQHLELLNTGIKKVPAEIGKIRGLELLELPAIQFDKKLLPGRWTVKKGKSHLTLTRTGP